MSIASCCANTTPLCLGSIFMRGSFERSIKDACTYHQTNIRNQFPAYKIFQSILSILISWKTSVERLSHECCNAATRKPTNTKCDFLGNKQLLVLCPKDRSTPIITELRNVFPCVHKRRTPCWTTKLQLERLMWSYSSNCWGLSYLPDRKCPIEAGSSDQEADPPRNQHEDW